MRTALESNDCFIIHCFEENKYKHTIVWKTVWHCSCKSCIAHTTYILVSYLLADNRLICRLHWFPKWTVGSQPMRRQILSMICNNTNDWQPWLSSSAQRPMVMRPTINESHINIPWFFTSEPIINKPWWITSIIITFVWQIPDGQTSLHVIQSVVGIVQTLEYSWASLCDPLSRATTYPKHQMVGISHKQPPLVNNCDHFLGWQFWKFFIVFNLF